MRYVVLITNIYEGGDEFESYEHFDAPKMPAWTEKGEAHADWWDDHVGQFTGTGRPEGDAGYFAEIVQCLPANPLIVTEDDEAIGAEWEWGT